jgi:hypothetical protein
MLFCCQCKNDLQFALHDKSSHQASLKQFNRIIQVFGENSKLISKNIMHHSLNKAWNLIVSDYNRYVQHGEIPNVQKLYRGGVFATSWSRWSTAYFCVLLLVAFGKSR